MGEKPILKVGWWAALAEKRLPHRGPRYERSYWREPVGFLF